MFDLYSFFLAIYPMDGKAFSHFPCFSISKVFHKDFSKLFDTMKNGRNQDNKNNSNNKVWAYTYICIIIISHLFFYSEPTKETEKNRFHKVFFSLILSILVSLLIEACVCNRFLSMLFLFVFFSSNQNHPISFTFTHRNFCAHQYNFRSSECCCSYQLYIHNIQTAI